ncbi:hypothetical protein RRG08_053504, partial [Elysia crispata]
AGEVFELGAQELCCIIKKLEPDTGHRLLTRLQ